jgi:hypothetical protein
MPPFVHAGRWRTGRRRTTNSLKSNDSGGRTRALSAPEQKGSRSPADAKLEALRRFLRDHVESLEELAVLAALRARRAEGPVELEAVVRATELPTQSVEEALARLTTGGLVSQVGDAVRAFAFVERDGDFGRLLEGALAEYSRNPLPVMALMSANAIERVRGAARRRFGESLRGAETKK